MRILAIVMILTLSACMVSQKTFDDKCCKMEADIEQLKSKCNSMDMKEQLLRQAIHDLRIKNDTTETNK